MSMIYYLGDQKIFLSKLIHKKLSSGKEGVVYHYKNMAIKINKKSRIRNIDIDHMTTLNCDRILLPRKKLITIMGHIKGYSTSYIQNNDLYKLFHLDTISLIEELYQLREELIGLSKHSIIISDWLLRNTMYDGKIRIVDPGRYAYDNNASNLTEVIEDNINIYNNYVINSLVLNNTVIDWAHCNGYANLDSYMIKRHLKNKMYDQKIKYIDQFLEKEMKNCSHIIEYGQQKIFK